MGHWVTFRYESARPARMMGMGMMTSRRRLVLAISSSSSCPLLALSSSRWDLVLPRGGGRPLAAMMAAALTRGAPLLRAAWGLASPVALTWAGTAPSGAFAGTLTTPPQGHFMR